MKTLITRIKRLALALCFVTPLVSWADAITAVNPVTGETETYTYKYVGTGDWTATDWQDGSDPAVNPGAAPQTPNSNVWDPLLIDGAYTLTSPTLEGWAIRLGVYNGAKVTVPTLNKIQAGTTMWFTVDATSKLTLSPLGTGHLGDNQNVNFYVAAQDGLVFNSNFATTGNDTDTFNYYLAGSGSVSFQGISAGTHKIKMADVTLSGSATPSVESKTLVSFTSTTKTFSADATVKVYDMDGSTLATTQYPITVNTTGETTLTASDPVGTVELVQTSTGIDLYFVDGDASTITTKTYLPSISVNFTSGTALSTLADIGVGDYAVPGTSWNNLIGNNGTLSTVTQVDSTGAASTVAGVGVTISGTRGYWTCDSVTAATDLRQGYIDDSGTYTSPQVVVSGIPYYSYYAVVYFSNHDANVPFGYVTINGTNYKWDSENSKLVECEGTSSDSWGASSPTAWTEGGNYIVTPTIVNSDGNFTIVSHRLSTSVRSGIAAIQIVEVPKQAADGELVINVSGDTTYTVSEDETYTTVYVTGAGTLAFSGEGAITTTTLNVGVGATVPMGSFITPTTVTGAGTVVYDGAQPSATLGFDDSASWFGTVWVKNIGTSPAGETANTAVTLGTDTNTAADNTINLWGNVNSCVKFTNVRGHVAASDCPWTLILEDDGDKYAWYNNNGWTAQNKDPVFAKLTGEGTFYDQANVGCRQNVTFTDATEFSGTFTVAGKRIGLGGVNTAPNNEAYRGTIEVVSGAAATIASGKTWTTGTGFRINGTLNVNGTLAAESTATTCVTGSGTVVFTGRAPTPTGDTWWKNSAWTGTVQMKNVTDLVGASSYTGTNFLPVDYGNTGSVLELYNCSGWLPNNSNYQCTVPLKITGTLTINDGISGSKFVISSLSGSGTIYTSNNSATITLQVLEASGFTGKVQLNSKRVVFGETLPSEYTVGNIYVGEGFSFTVPNSDVAWYGTGGITLAGELKAAALSNFGGGTTITTTDTGVFTLVSNSNADDMNVDYTRIQGTGTLKFEGTNYRTISTNNFPTAMIVENNLNNGLIHRISNLEVTIGSLSGSGQMRSDWDGSGSTGDRDLRILQAKDTTYSGLFASSNDRIDEVYVAPGASTAGTLTLSGAQTASNGLIVETGASVNLTGTWVGATTVAGTFGGTGTLTGDLTFSDGATFKVFATDDNGLAVSGTVTCPAEGKVTVDVSALEDTGTFALLTASELDDKFALAEGAPEGATLAVVEGVLTLTVPTPPVSITIPTVANATVAVTVDGVPVTPENGVVTAQVGAAVVVTYTADEGYKLEGTGTFNFSATDGYSVDVSSTKSYAIVARTDDDQTFTRVPDALTYAYMTTGVEVVTVIDSTWSDDGTYDEYFAWDATARTYTKRTYVARIGAVSFTSLAAAIAYEGAEDPIVVLLADVTLNSTVVVTKSLTLDMNGCDIAATDARALWIKAGTVSITGEGEISANATENSSFSDSSSVIRVGDSAVNANAASLTIGADVTVSSGHCYGVTAFGKNTPGISLVVNGTVAVTGTASAISGNGSSGLASANITVNDGAVVSAMADAGIYFPGTGTLSVAGGTITGPTAVYAKCGTINITGGTLTGTAAKAAYAYNGNGLNATGDALVIDTCGYPGNPATVSVTGGTFTSQNAEAVASYKKGDDAKYADDTVNEAATGFVTGGMFSSDVSAFCATGYEATEDSGVWTVAALPNYTVTFDVDGDTTAIAAQTVQKGSTATEPEAPTKADYTFAGWTLGGSAYDFATPVTGNITLVASWTPVSSGIDPTVDGSTQEVTVDTSLTAEEQEAAAIAAATVTVPDGVSGVDAATYKTYFTYSATPTETAGTYDVAITGFADEVTETADGNALSALEAATAGATLGSIEVKPGLYYGTVAGADVTTLKAPAGTLNTTGTLDLSGVTKPSTGEAFFIKIKVGTTAFTAEE